MTAHFPSNCSVISATCKLAWQVTLVAVVSLLLVTNSYADAFVSNLGDGTVPRYDDKGNKISDDYLNGGSGGGEGVSCIKASTNEIYVANNSGQIGVYELNNGKKGNHLRDIPKLTLGGNIAALSFSKDGSVLYVANYGSRQIYALNPVDGSNVYPPINSDYSHDVVVGPDGYVYAAYFSSQSGVRKYTANLTSYTQFIPDNNTDGLRRPAGMVFDRNGNFWISNFTGATDAAIFEYSSTGTFIRKISDLKSNGTGAGPFGLDLGPDGNVYNTNLGDDSVTFVDIQGGTYALKPFISGSPLYEPKYVRFTENCCDLGYLEICKTSCPLSPVTGNFTFTASNSGFNSGPLSVPVNACTGAIQLPSGTVSINEWLQLGVHVTAISANGYNKDGGNENRLVSDDLPFRNANVTVVPGDSTLETLVTYTNCQAPPGLLKICKVAGQGITVGDYFDFVTLDLDGGYPINFRVPAGPPPDGYCVQAGTYQVGTQVYVGEVGKSGTSVTDITVTPPDRGGRKDSGSVIAAIDTGVTEVTFTNAAQSFFSNLGQAGNLYQCGTMNSGWNVAGSGSPLKQSFTQAAQFQSSISGSVRQIDLGVTYSSGVNLFDVSIWSNSNNLPGMVLAYYPNLSAGRCGSLVTIVIPTGLSLVAGQSYWLVVGPSSQTSTTLEVWHYNSIGQKGLGLTSNDGGITWNNNGNVTLGAFDVLP